MPDDRRRRSAPLFAMALLALFPAASSVAQTRIAASSTVREEQRAAVERLNRAVAESVLVDWNEITGTPIFVSGRLSTASSVRSVDSATRAALQFLTDNSDLFRLDSPAEELRLFRTSTDERGGQHVVFNRVYRDLLVWKSEIAVHFSPDGSIESINGRYHPTFRISVTPAVSAADALAAAGADAGIPTAPAAGTQLLIYPERSELVLAWKVAYPTVPFPALFYIVDATTRRVLFKDTGIRQ